MFFHTKKIHVLIYSKKNELNHCVKNTQKNFKTLLSYAFQQQGNFKINKINKSQPI